jgi:hypothetical protein
MHPGSYHDKEDLLHGGEVLDRCDSLCAWHSLGTWTSSERSCFPCPFILAPSGWAFWISLRDGHFPLVKAPSVSFTHNWKGLFAPAGSWRGEGAQWTFPDGDRYRREAYVCLFGALQKPLLLSLHVYKTQVPSISMKKPPSVKGILWWIYTIN